MPPAQAAFASPHQPTSLAHHAYLAIRDRILRGDLKLGVSVSRRKLAAELGVSLLPVAEALQRLESEGLVESRPRIGTRVCQPTAEDIRQRYEIREALETQAARLFAEKSSLRERQELKKMAEHMDELFEHCFSKPTDSETLYAIHDYHAQLHLRIAECTGCRLLSEALQRNHVLIFNWVFDVAAERPPLPQGFHSQLIDALSGGDPEAADRAMRQHVRYGLQNILRGIKPREELPVEEAPSSKAAPKRRATARSKPRKGKTLRKG